MKKLVFLFLMAMQAQAVEHQIRTEFIRFTDHQIQQAVRGIRITNTLGLVRKHLSAEIRAEAVQSRMVQKPYYWQNVQFTVPVSNTPSVMSLSLIKQNLVEFSGVEISLRGGYRQIFAQVNDPGLLIGPQIRASLGALTVRAGYEFSNSVRSKSDAKYSVRRVGMDYHLTPAWAAVAGYELQRGFLNRTAWTFGFAYQPQ